jgi:hypothetical protein
MNTLQNWTIAAVMALVISVSWQLDGPSEIEVMQAVAEKVALVESAK